jgi:hypothetical protein
MQLERILASLVNVFLRLFGINKGRDHSQDLSRSYYSARADLANRSFGYSRSAGNYSLVRDTNKNRGQMSPQRYHRPADGTVYSRGSVVSPQSMNQHQHYGGPQNVRDSAFLRLQQDSREDQ